MSASEAIPQPTNASAPSALSARTTIDEPVPTLGPLGASASTAAANGGGACRVASTVGSMTDEIMSASQRPASRQPGSFNAPDIPRTFPRPSARG